MIDIRSADSPSDLDAARELFREYAASLPFSLAYQGFEDELAGLPGKYAAPLGRILLAWDGPSAVGCIAVRPLVAQPRDLTPVCEMKRMYVRPQARGRKVGRALCEGLLAFSRNAGYRLMKLDTESDFVAATALYRSMGFTPCPRYNDDPLPSTIWMSKVLS